MSDAAVAEKLEEERRLVAEAQAGNLDAMRPIFEGYAKQIGLDIQRYQQDVSSDAVSQRIFMDGKRGHSMGVKGTPTVFLNGREVPFESLAPEKLRVVLQNELRNPEK